MDVTLGWVMIAGFAAAVAAYGINRVFATGADERRIKHEEFTARLPDEHMESMAKIAANRDVEMSKALKAEPKPMIDLKAE